MKYFFDTEFLEDGHTIDLISIGIVAEDGREYYGVVKALNWVRFFNNSWLVEHVLPSLPIKKINKKDVWCYGNFTEDYSDPAWKTREQLRDDILAFCDIQTYGKPEFWAYYADYDWVALCQLFGTMMDIPNGWPMYCRDIKQVADQWENARLPEQGKDEHNALADARWNKTAFEFLRDIPANSFVQLPKILGMLPRKTLGRLH